MHDDQPRFWRAVDAIREREDRYPREAYAFVVNALGFAAERLPRERRSDPVRRHLSGAELLAAALDLARLEFGVMAPTVLREWGLRAGGDVGRIVFALIEAGELSAREDDRFEDFLGVDDLPGALSRAPEARPGRPAAGP